jgi:hypothetical protein
VAYELDDESLFLTFDVSAEIDLELLALGSSGLDRVRVRQRPRLLSDNGPSYATVPSGPLLMCFVQPLTAAGFTFRGALRVIRALSRVALYCPWPRRIAAIVVAFMIPKF